MKIFGGSLDMIRFVNLFTATTGAADATAGATGSMLMTIIPFVLVFVLMYFFMIRPQKKKEKEATEMRNSLQVGDTVTTIGGITGIVNSLHEDEVVLETTTDRTKLCFKRWAIQEVKKLEL